MSKYLFLVVDRYSSSKTTAHYLNSKMELKPAFRFAYLENVDNDAEFYETDIEPNLNKGDNLIAFDGEEYSYILLKQTF